MKIIFRFVVFLLLASVYGCGGGSDSPAITTDGLLPGDGTDLAISHVLNYDNTQGVEETDVAMAANGRHIALTQLEIWLEDSATVADVNQALQANGARIISMITNVPILLLEVSRPENPAALEVIAERLASSPAIKKVDFVDIPFPSLLPLNHSDSDVTGLNTIYQLIATKNLAARNAKHALGSSLSVPPTIIVVDFFGDGKPGAAFDIVTDAADYSQNAPNDHGYHVLGIISALDGGSSKVTGAYPDTSFIKTVDLIVSPTRFLSQAEWHNKIVQTMVDNPAVSYIVNTSLSITCGPAEALVPCSAADMQAMAYNFITKIRSAGDSGIEDSYLHVSAAGNVSEGFTYAYEAAPVNYASLRTDVVDSDGNSVAPLSNVISVENVMIDMAEADFPSFPYCLSAGSVSGGHVSAPGNGITSFIDASGAEANKSGTSMAAPMVAATAAYLWALEPELTPQEIKRRLIATGEPVSGGGSGCSSVDSKPFLDAYRVLLTADDESALTSGLGIVAGRVRGTILDVADSMGNPGSNGRFDEKDIELFVSIYDGDTAGQLDYSRYDLNGDGWTGGSMTTAFDLDMDRMIEVFPLVLDGRLEEYDENDVCDEDILCYYAYSPLFTGDDTRFEELMGARCGLECVLGSSSGLDYYVYYKRCQPDKNSVTLISHSIYSSDTWVQALVEKCNVEFGANNEECPDPIVNASTRYQPDSTFIGMYITTWNDSVPTSVTYICDPDNRLYKIEYDPDYKYVQMGSYLSYSACVDAIMWNYVPSGIDQSDLRFPGDCHEWWDHGAESCVY